MKVIVIGGYPGSGKSTIMRAVLKELEKAGYRFQDGKYKTVTYMESNKNLIIFGSYAEGETFPGTDRFPLNVQPEAVAFLSQLQADENEFGIQYTVVLEGDRLFNNKMLDFIRNGGAELVLCIVELDLAKLEARRNERSKQSETWRKGRHTKVDRIKMTYPVNHVLLNSTSKEQAASVEELVKEILGQWKSEPVKSKLNSFWS